MMLANSAAALTFHERGQRTKFVVTDVEFLPGDLEKHTWELVIIMECSVETLVELRSCVSSPCFFGISPDTPELEAAALRHGATRVFSVGKASRMFAELSACIREFFADRT